MSSMFSLFAIDADTRVKETALKYLVHRLENKKSVTACCGETRVDNKTQSLVTMLQVFEYYSSHHVSKNDMRVSEEAIESCF